MYCYFAYKAPKTSITIWTYLSNFATIKAYYIKNKGEYAMKKLILSGAVLTALSFGVSNPVYAITISLLPATQTTTVGSPFDVQIQISGLRTLDPSEVLSAFGMDVSYDSSLLSATGIVFGDLLGGGTGDSVAFFDWTTTADLFTLNETSLLSDSDLTSLQSDSFTLATLHFTAANEGVGSLAIQNISLAGHTPVGSTFPSDLNDPTAQTVGAEVINQPRHSVVPEPAILALMIVGFLVPFLSKRKNQV